MVYDPAKRRSYYLADRERQKLLYQEHKEEVLIRAKTNYAKNKVKVLERQKKVREENIERNMWQKVKDRANSKDIEFSIDVEDIIIPEFCPVLGIPLFRNTGGNGPKTNSPTLDRINPKKGYVKGNVIVISYRANRIKNDATWQELQSIANWLKKLTVVE